MLELIVLGEIPGTQIVISFTWALAAFMLFMGAVVFRRNQKRHNSSDTNNIDDITL